MIRTRQSFWPIAIAAWLTSVGHADPLQNDRGLPRGPEPVLKAATFWSASAVAPGGQATLALVLDIRKPYHINADRTTEGFIPTSVEWVDPPEVLRSSTPVFPNPEEIQRGTEKARVFTGRAVVFLPIALSSSAKPGELHLQVQVRYQACDDRNCLFPTRLTEKVALAVVPPSSPIQSTNPEIFSEMPKPKESVKLAFFGWDFNIETSKVWALLLAAAVGGMLLNFTPCVLPLIPIKIMGLSHAAGSSRRRCFLLGLTLSVGIVAFWMALAGAISSIRGFNTTNQLFQLPAFTIGVGVVICAMALGMCGLFALNLPQWIYRVNPSQESFGGSFFFGIMTAVLSTPCTAPFMGAAAAWSATQPPAITLGTFAAIGLGMAFPYLLLSTFPFLVKCMPRTGPASELIKQVMGLLMLAAGTYFLGTGLAGRLAKPPDPPSHAFWWGVALFVAAAGFWLSWRTFRITAHAGRRVVFGGLGLLGAALAFSMGVHLTQRSPIHWVYYTPERLSSAQKEGKVVVVEFTAAWCLNCELFERTVLHNPSVVRLLNSPGVEPIKVDLTGNNPVGDQKLLEVGRRTIPYLVIYSSSGQQIFASDAYTVEQVTQAVGGALAKRVARLTPPAGSF